MTPAPRRLLPAAPLAALAAAFLLPVGSAGAVPPPVTCGRLDLTDAAAVVANAQGTEDVFIGRVVRIDSGPTAGGGSTAPAATATATGTPTPGAGRTVRHEVLVEDALTGDLHPGEPVRVVFSAVGGKQTQPAPQRQPTSSSPPAPRPPCGPTAATATSRPAASPPPPSTPSATPLHRTTSRSRRSLSAPSGGSDGAPGLGRVVAPGAAVGLVGILGLVLLSRVGRRKP
ncbi:hypothetical protein G5V59_18555 [Nocardioides sp. W3-2-3]|uniref:hypothetical protein n=1 Tax=Nocardioides convexus TaxID=2712224 RepID=UPI002418A88B|nr:hypothetical protein [Nocardioides convexus]NHA01175.1 hypothetical protein [Nocardioides convexus]